MPLRKVAGNPLEQPVGGGNLALVKGNPFMDAIDPGITDTLGTKAIEAQKLYDEFNKREPGIDYSMGASDFGFRMGFGRQDNDKERAGFLDKSVGAQNWKKDKFGAYILMPEGRERLGLAPSNMPTPIDEHLPTRYDIADIRGEAAPIAAAVGAGIATGGMGLVPALGYTALAAGGATAWDEIMDYFRGESQETSGEIGTRIGTEAALATGGEIVSRKILAPIGRRLLAPEAGRISEKGRQLLKESQEMGAKPSISQVTKAPILSRTQSMVHTIFGDPAEQTNRIAIQSELDRLLAVSGSQPALRKTVWEETTASIKAARSKLAKTAAGKYDAIDSVVGGKPIVPTSRTRAMVDEIVGESPKTETGELIFIAPETQKFLKNMSKLPEHMTTSQMQVIRQELFQAMRGNNLIPGLSRHNARKLYNSLGQDFDRIGEELTLEAYSPTPRYAPGFEEPIDPSVVQYMSGKAVRPAARQRVAEKKLSNLQASAEKVKPMLKEAGEYYKKEIAKFDDELIARITRDPSEAGSIDPETLTDVIFKKGRGSRVERVRAVVDDETWAKVQSQSMKRILDDVVQATQDPEMQVFNGKALVDTLNKYDRATLGAMFGKKKTEELYKFARVTQYVTQNVKARSGGIVAAGIAVRPLKHLGVLMKFRIMTSFLNSKYGIKWLTTGLEVPNTRRGANALAKVVSQFEMLADEQTGAEYTVPSLGGQPPLRNIPTQ